MKFAHLLTAFYFQPWAIRPEVHRELGRQLQSYLKNGSIGARAPIDRRSDMPGDSEDSSECDREELQAGSGVMVIPIHGIIGKHLDMLETMCGGYDLAWLKEDIDCAMADPSIHTVIFDLNTPGGTATGLIEAADLILELGKVKHTIAFSDVQCCSAGYWLAAACGEILAARSAQIGSIGTYIAAIDDTREWENEGLKLKLFRDGALKGMGLSGKEWTPEEDAFLQGRVDKASAAFKGFVRSRRPGIAETTMQGQWFDGDECQPLRLIDGIAADLDSVITAAIAAGMNR